MTDETRQSPTEAVSHEHLKSVVHRRSPLTKKDYSEAIADLKRARMQDRIAHICCSVCEDTGHTAETCHHNPLLLARQWSQATGVWCCYHCGYTATNDQEAREHFGANDTEPAQCQREFFRRLVDWTYLYALEGNGGWPDSATITEPLISLAKMRAPSDEDQRQLQAGATLKQLSNSHRPEGS